MQERPLNKFFLQLDSLPSKKTEIPPKQFEPLLLFNLKGFSPNQRKVLVSKLKLHP